MNEDIDLINDVAELRDRIRRTQLELDHWRQVIVPELVEERNRWKCEAKAVKSERAIDGVVDQGVGLMDTAGDRGDTVEMFTLGGSAECHFRLPDGDDANVEVILGGQFWIFGDQRADFVHKLEALIRRYMI